MKETKLQALLSSPKPPLQKRRFFVFMACLLFCSVSWANTVISFEIYGIQGKIKENVQARLQAELSCQRSRDTFDCASNVDVNQLYDRAPVIIEKAIQPFGYFKSNIQQVSLKQQKNAWLVTYDVSLGQPLTYSQIDIQISGKGSDNKIIRDAIKHFPLQKNHVFNTEEYEKAKTLLLAAAQNEGYVKARFEKSVVTIDLDANHADLKLHLDTGDQYYFGPVEFTKNPFSNQFLHRMVPFKPNEPFSTKKLYEFQQSLSNNLYFSQVEITPDLDQTQDHHIPTRVAVSVPKSEQYNLGIGYGTLTGPRLTAGMNLKRLTDSGQHMNAQMKLSSVLSGFAAKYYIPGKNPLTDEYMFGTTYQRFMPKNGRSYSETLSTGFLKKSDHWHNSLTLNYLTERYQVNNNSYERSELLYPSLNLSYVHADDLINPTQGESFNFVLQGAVNDIVSSTSFLQGRVKGKYLFSPYEMGKVIVRGDAGYTLVNNLLDLPLSMRFFAGGPTSIRGYPDSSIGPGKYLMVGSVEYRHRIHENWYGAIFTDVGTATNHFGSQLKRGDGVGVVYQSIIGPVKVYVARAEDTHGRPLHMEFSVGAEF